MLNKQSASLNFAQGLDTKTDPKQVPFGKFLKLVNSVFTKAGLLQKRNGFGALSSLSSSSTYLTTFGGNLTAIGNTLRAYVSGNKTWVNKGALQPVNLSVLPVARSAINQTQCDSVTATNGLICTVYTEVNNGTAAYYYVIADSTTGQIVVAPTLIPVSSGVVTGSPRVFLLANYFVVVFTNVITAISHLQYIAISVNRPTTVTANADIASSYDSAAALSWDGVVVGQNLYVAYNTATGSQQIKITYLSSSLALAAATSFSASIATNMSVTADTTGPTAVIYAAFWDSAGSTGNAVAVDETLAKRMSATQWLGTGTIDNVTCAAQNGVLTIIYANHNNYAYDSAVQSNFLSQNTITLPATVTTGTVGVATTVLRSLGLASKAFLMNSTVYALGTYQSPLQNTYFLFDVSGNIIARFAYENGGGYLTKGLPQAQVIGSSVFIPYLYKDLIQSTNTSGLVQSIGAAGASNIYSQTGVNVVSLQFSSNILSVSEIGQNLNLTGGMLWAYDGQTINEQGFHVFPDSIEATWSASGGSIHAQPDGSTNTNAYYYQVTYEWTDAQGNIIRSAPSVPIGVTTTSNGTSGSITVHIPTLRLTYKSGVKIVIYRWSVANESYYQVTSITAPTLNDKTTDAITYVDTLADASIVGNNIIYTAGGVIENISGPASIATTLFDDRLWLIDAEDQNLLWYSKQVIEATPVELSDLLTIYVAPTIGAQGSTGKIKCIFPMDDKIILFKENAIYYINGTGPNNTGSGSQYSEPIFITSSVGCSNQKSIVLIPSGLMFQSNKGIWILGRDLSTQYIGAEVEAYNAYTITSTNLIPATTQVRFSLSSGDMLMFDYFYNQWGTFEGAPTLSSTLYNGLHTLIDSYGNISQETPGIYLDNGNPVLLSFLTSWINLTGLQGYQRAYFFYILGQYISPHKLQLGIAYDYNSSLVSAPLITPNNYAGNYGGFSPYGQNPYGSSPIDGDVGRADVEQWRVFMQKQRCQAFQISLQEVYDSNLGLAAGAGFTLSGLNLIYGSKKSFRPMPASQSVG